MNDSELRSLKLEIVANVGMRMVANPSPNELGRFTNFCRQLEYGDCEGKLLSCLANADYDVDNFLHCLAKRNFNKFEYIDREKKELEFKLSQVNKLLTLKK